MSPMRYRGFIYLPMGDWSQNPIGLPYRWLHPVSEFQYYDQKITTGSCLGPILNIPVKMLCDLFPKGVFTVKLYNSYHQDKNNRNSFTRGIITRPISFLPTEEHIDKAFAIGSNVFSFKEANLSMIFSGVDTLHCTTMSVGVPDMHEILKEKTMKSIIANEKEVKSYLKKSSLSVCVYGATNIGLQKKRGILINVKGPKYLIAKFKFYKCYMI